MNFNYTEIFRNNRGAVGLLSVILLTSVALVFTLTISHQILQNVKNTKLSNDFKTIYYSTEGGIRDARMQLKKEALISGMFEDVSLDGITVNREVSVTLSANSVIATGSSPFITRVFKTNCLPSMTSCSSTENAPEI